MIWRIRMFSRRLLEYIFRWPLAVWRLILWILWINSPNGKHAIMRWLCGIVLLTVDLTPLNLLYETVMDALKKKTRPLNKEELDIVLSVFGKRFPFQLVGLDPDSIPVKKKRTTAYVSFHTINFFNVLPAQTLIHELVHVWQYRKHGSVYISEAIWAQKWGGGYNYGGLEPLIKYSEGKGLSSFNFEQQADIIEDYYRWKNGIPLQWALNVPGVGHLLEKYKDQLEDLL